MKKMRPFLKRAGVLALWPSFLGWPLPLGSVSYEERSLVSSPVTNPCFLARQSLITKSVLKRQWRRALSQNVRSVQKKSHGMVWRRVLKHWLSQESVAVGGLMLPRLHAGAAVSLISALPFCWHRQWASSAWSPVSAATLSLLRSLNGGWQSNRDWRGWESKRN